MFLYLIIKVSLLVRCPNFRGLNVCTLLQMGPWASVQVSTFHDQGVIFEGFQCSEQYLNLEPVR